MDCKFPYYSGNIFKPKARGDVELTTFITNHKYPTDLTKDVISKIHHARKTGNVELKKSLKQKLYAFTPCVRINKGDARKYANVRGFTGLMQIDLDGIPSKEYAESLKTHIFNEYDEIVCCYISPSGLGLKALMKINIDTDPELYKTLHAVENELRLFKALHKAVENEFKQYEHFDPATKNAILPLFLSYDEDILYRKFEECPAWDKQDWSKPKYVSLNTKPKERTNDNNYDRVVRIITERINRITGDGHPQVRSTSLVLGSRVGAGYISQAEAEFLIEQLIRSNSYLQKGVPGYVRTAFWGIKNGMNNPKYF